MLREGGGKVSLPIEKFLFVQMVAMISLLNLNKFGRLKKNKFYKRISKQLKFGMGGGVVGPEV